MTPYCHCLLRGGTALLAFLSVIAASAAAQGGNNAKAKPRVEVVFCLDTTGSMGNLIDAAKKKIWSISNQIAGGKPTPELKIGLVAYRDRGDAYVTKIYDLTDNLDSIYSELMNFKAQGGGDFPESVNQALHDAVTKIKWSPDQRTLKIVFLVGDAPPKMSYGDDVHYQATCQRAAKNGIIINTVQCGEHAATTKYWKRICRLAAGSYVHIDAKQVPAVVLETPYDKELSKINKELAETTLSFGSMKEQAKAEELKSLAGELGGSAAADRAGFLAKNKGGTSYDLLWNIQNGKVKLKDLKKEQLPPVLQKLTLQEQKAYLKKLAQRRGVLTEKVLELEKQRNAFITKQQKTQATTAPVDQFDTRVLQILQDQAKRIDVKYKGSTPKK